MFLDCGGILHLSEGSLASPNWPRNFYHNMNCVWTIDVPLFRVRVYFQTIQIFL